MLANVNELHILNSARSKYQETVRKIQ